jgi:hypothetical protein
VKPERIPSPLPPPNPEDPASYPLPPSPDLRPPLEVTTGYADPLGASPLLPVSEDTRVPGLVLEDTEDISGVATAEKQEKVTEGVVEEAQAAPVEEDEPLDLDDAKRRCKGISGSLFLDLPLRTF